MSKTGMLETYTQQAHICSSLYLCRHLLPLGQLCHLTKLLLDLSAGCCSQHHVNARSTFPPSAPAESVRATPNSKDQAHPPTFSEDHPSLLSLSGCTVGSTLCCMPEFLCSFRAVCAVFSFSLIQQV